LEEYSKIKQLYLLHQEELREMRSRDNSREYEQLDGGQSGDQLNWDDPDAPPSNSPQ
jgi:predicted  nucleic acid-binding Zn-ribbon protein